jgi:hypothetical protein
MLNGLFAVLTLLIVGCGGGGGGDSGSQPYYFKITTWQDAELEHGGQYESEIEKVKPFSLLEIQKYLLSFELEYKFDKKIDNWKISEQTEADGGGDCEDLAHFYYLRLRELGYWPDDSLVLVMLDNSSAKTDHVVVAFKTSSGDWYCIDQIADKPYILLLKKYFLKDVYHIIAEYNLFDIWYDDFPTESD